MGRKSRQKRELRDNPDKGIVRNRQRSIIPTVVAYDPNDDLYIATHEAAHAVAAVILGIRLNSVDLKIRRLPDGRKSVGFTDTMGLDFLDIAGKGEDAAMPHLIVSLVGGLAESSVNRQVHHYDSHELDVKDARRITAVALCDATTHEDRFEISTEEQVRNAPRVERLLKAALGAAIEFVEAHFEIICAVSDELRKRRELTGKEVADIIATMRHLAIKAK